MREDTLLAGAHPFVVEATLDDATRDELSLRLAASKGQLDADTDTMILTGIGSRALRTCLSSDVLEKLTAFTSGCSYILKISNLPQHEDLPETPACGYTDERELAFINALHLGLLAVLDLTPYAVDYENDGKLMRNVAPHRGATLVASSWGSRREFFWHTDNPHLPFGVAGCDPRPAVPGFLTFYTVRNEEEVPTDLLTVDQVVGTLSHEVRETLHQPLFDIAAPASNDTLADGRPMVLQETAVIDWHARSHRARYDKDTTTSRDEAGERALEAWRDALDMAPAVSPVLRPGEFLVFDNTRVVHRRRAFTPGPQPRWLRRCYASR